MAIKIIDEGDIRMTQGEHDRLMWEYKQAMQYYAGPPIPFEEWVRRKLRRSDKRENQQ